MAQCAKHLRNAGDRRPHLVVDARWHAEPQGHANALRGGSGARRVEKTAVPARRGKNVVHEGGIGNPTGEHAGHWQGALRVDVSVIGQPAPLDLQAEEVAARRRDADRAAPVSGGGEGDQAGRDRRRAPAA